MIRLVLIFSLLFMGAYAKESTDKKINKTTLKLKKSKKSQNSINRKMALNAKAILKQKKEIREQNRFLKKLSLKIKAKEQTHKENLLKLKEFSKNQNELKNRQNAIEEELVFTIAQGVSLTVMLEGDVALNTDSLIEKEVLQAMLSASKKKANTLNNDYYSNSKAINKLKEQISSLEVGIANMDLQQRELLRIQKANKKALATLEKAKKSYKTQVKLLIKKRSELQTTLASLNIIKIDEIKKAKEEEQQRLAFEKEKAQKSYKKVTLDKNLPKVKKHGSSYEAVKTKKYNGVKTIAPLDSYTITKKYGTYTDPVYGIKIFNESISLRPKHTNAKVKTVFNGKVIYADRTAVLDNIVIVEHKNGLHTIYANLSQIPSNIKKGKKIKKGTTIGRIKDELIFEVTQKSFHINPIRLFK
jgi:murein DD-endopeptidase MepM/ murein hydrolase activator NlpD